MMEFNGKNMINNLSAFAGCTSLKSITIKNSNVVDISGLKDLPLLNKLILSNNSISSCVPLKNLKSLNYLDLQNNSISDVSWDGDVSYNNLKILADLNVNSGNGGNLSTLYLSGNTGIVDFTPVSTLKWNDWNGF